MTYPVLTCIRDFAFSGHEVVIINARHIRDSIIPSQSCMVCAVGDQAIIMKMVDEMEVWSYLVDGLIIISDMITDVIHAITIIRHCIDMMVNLEPKVVAIPADACGRQAIVEMNKVVLDPQFDIV